MPVPAPSPAQRRASASRDRTSKASNARTAWACPTNDSAKHLSVNEPDAISPLLLAKNKDVDDFSLDHASSDHRATAQGRRFSVRRTRAFSSSSPRVLPTVNGARRMSRPEDEASHSESSKVDSILDKVVDWLHDEKKKRRGRRHKHHRHRHRSGQLAANKDLHSDGACESPASDASDDSDSSIALDKLEDILKTTDFFERFRRRSSVRAPRRPLRQSSSTKRLRRPSTGFPSSDTEYVDGDALVPTCEVVLDNSKTLSYGSVGISSSQLSLDDGGDDAFLKNKEAWSTFKFEITRLTHTLRIKGWRRVPLERSDEIDVERLCGALTNAVYVVSPPQTLDRPHRHQSSDQNSSASRPTVSKRAPKKLLLRIYGPQVEHLIDREAELMTLRRLARQRIGPRLLGTFINGRFEEYLHAQTLTPRDLRDPQTSIQIAKRMRELHDGIELLREEREGGPFMWRNWDKWVERCGNVVKHVDHKILHGSKHSASAAKLRKRGLVCGTEWAVFREAVDKYRHWLNDQYGSTRGMAESLVFAHNDTQYGNILRLEPPGESPLLLPANKHKQLVVIDFEYANANTRGLEFANHFTEWCYNYHDETYAHTCNTQNYPTPDEQARFLRAYASHRPAFIPATSTPRLTASTPSLGPSDSYTSATAASRRPTFSRSDNSTPSAAQPTMQNLTSTPNLTEEPAPLSRTDTNTSVETAGAPVTDGEIARLARDTWLWRAANSAQWVAWGIVQARVPGLAGGAERAGDGDGADADDEDDEEEFDYLSYARERAMFFWGDVVQLGIVDEAALPRDVRDGMKTVRY